MDEDRWSDDVANDSIDDLDGMLGRPKLEDPRLRPIRSRELEPIAVERVRIATPAACAPDSARLYLFPLREGRPMRSLASHKVLCSYLTLAIPVAAIAQSKRVAVYDFDYSAVKGDVVQVYGSDKPVGTQVANRIISKLVNSSNISFDVIDRNQIDRRADL